MRLDFSEALADERTRGEPAASVKITFYRYAGRLGGDPRLLPIPTSRCGVFFPGIRQFRGSGNRGRGCVRRAFPDPRAGESPPPGRFPGPRAGGSRSGHFRNRDFQGGFRDKQSVQSACLDAMGETKEPSNACLDSIGGTKEPSDIPSCYKSPAIWDVSSGTDPAQQQKHSKRIFLGGTERTVGSVVPTFFCGRKKSSVESVVSTEPVF